MKYVITGGAGNISRPLAETLLKAGQEVTVIGRNADKLKTLTDHGAKVAIGSLDDRSFLTNAFAGADAVYLMIPPNYGSTDMRAFQNTVAQNYVAAIEANQVKNVVALSSIGAHMGNGAGPVDGLADMEALLKGLKNTAIKVLRPSYFMMNLFGMIPLVKNANIMGANFGGTDEPLVLVHTNDIAAAAAEELLNLNFSGYTVRYVAGDEKTGAEIAEILGNAIGKPGTPWVPFGDEQSLEGMKNAGLPVSIAESFTAMGKAIREGNMQKDYWQHHPVLDRVKLQDFAKEFAVAFKATD